MKWKCRICEKGCETDESLVMHIIETHREKIPAKLWESWAEEIGFRNLLVKKDKSSPEIEIVLWNLKANKDTKFEVNIGGIIDTKMDEIVANCLVLQTDKVRNIVVWYFKGKSMKSERAFWKYQSMVGSMATFLYPNSQIKLQQYKLGMALGSFSFPKAFQDIPEYIRLRSQDIGSPY